MELKLNTASFSSAQKRREFAVLLAGLVGEPQNSFEPYCTTPGDDMHWVVDRDNTWRVAFEPAKPNCARVLYRYQCATVQAEEALLSKLQGVRAEVVLA